MKIKYLKPLLALAVSGALLYGCSDGADTSSTATGTNTGIFVDAPVSGLSYSTPSMGSGITDTEGKFKYKGSDVVTFTVGPVELGGTKGQPIVTPLVLMSKYASDSIHVKAMASLLQSLDIDDKLNLIQLPSDFTNFGDKLKAAGLEVPFKFANASVDQLDTFVTVVNDYVSNDDNPETNFVSLEDAYVQLATGLLENDALLMNVSKTPEGYSDKAGIQPIASANGEVNALVMSYEDGTGIDGAPDAWGAISIDNGVTWKKTNLSRNGGQAIKVKNLDFKVDNGGPSMHVEGNYVLASWISTDCPKANPFNVDEEITPILDTETTDPAAPNADLFQVAGSQGIVSYSFGNVPFHCVWTRRGVLQDTGKLVWYKGEQLTSGRRDAKLDWPAGAENVAFGITFQEDPEGLEPGLGEGPGLGWSGATAHHKTDIWYSHVNWADFATPAEGSCVPTAELDDNSCYPIAAVRLNPPVRVSDNAACKTDASGTGEGPLYCNVTTALATDGPVYCKETVTNDVGTFCKTSYTDENSATVGFPIDGNTAATRPNLHFAVTAIDDSGTPTDAVALLTYEETKGLCREVDEKGCPDDPWAIGKFVMYHHFPFSKPDTVHHGYIVSQPATEEQLYSTVEDDIGVPYIWADCSAVDIYEDGTADDNACYENARRERFTTNNDPTNNVKVAMIYKQGAFKQGERADIFMRRLVGDDFKSTSFTDNVCISCGTAATDTTTGDITMSYAVENLTDGSTTNILDDARSLRASLDGDRLLVGFAWTADWLKATTANPDGWFSANYDFLVRRSFDGGETWDEPRNTSNLKKMKESVVEPRIAPVEFEFGEPLQKTFVVTYCTAENKVRIADTDGEPTHAPGLDCYYARTIDDGETYEVTDTDGDGIPDFLCLACGDTEQVEPEVFLTPDGNVLHSAWAQTGDLYDNGGEMQNGSDIWYRQICSDVTNEACAAPTE